MITIQHAQNICIQEFYSRTQVTLAFLFLNSILCRIVAVGHKVLHYLSTLANIQDTYYAMFLFQKTYVMCDSITQTKQLNLSSN